MSIECKKPSFTIDLNAPPPQEEEEDDYSKTEPDFSDLIARELTLELANKKECVENYTKLEALLLVVEIATREHEISENSKSEDEEEERRAKPPHANKNEAAVAIKERPVRSRRVPNKYDDSLVGQMCYPLRRRKGNRDGDVCDDVGPPKGERSPTELTDGNNCRLVSGLGSFGPV